MADPTYYQDILPLFTPLDIDCMRGRGVYLASYGYMKDEGNAIKVLVVSMYPEDQYAMRALRAGAFGYVNKGGDPQLLVTAVRTVARDCEQARLFLHASLR